MDDETKIKRCYRQMYQAMTEKDLDTLSQVLNNMFGSSGAAMAFPIIDYI